MSESKRKSKREKKAHHQVKIENLELEEGLTRALLD